MLSIIRLSYTASIFRGSRCYELTDHRGNVMAVVSDRKVGVDEDEDGKIDYYKAVVVSATDYYSFGKAMPGRNTGSYRYGFNGKENDGDIKRGVQDYGMRMNDVDLCRFFSADPLGGEYCWFTPYQFAGNKPITAIDLDGLENWELSTIRNNLMREPILRQQADENGKRQVEQKRAAMIRELNSRPAPQLSQAKQFTPMQAQQHEAIRARKMGDAGYNPDGSRKPLTKAADNTHFTKFADNVALPMIEQLAFDGLGKGALSLYRKATQVSSRVLLGEYTNEQASMVYKIVEEGTLPGSRGAFLGRSRLSNAQMEALTEQYGVEFAQTYTAGLGKNGGGGYYTLYSGTRSRLPLEVNSNVYLINHTHPGGTVSPSTLDVDYLKKLAETGSPQRSSVILPVGKQPVRFNVNTQANGIE